MTVQWKNSDNEGRKVCAPPKSKRDIVSACDLSNFIDSPAAARDINLRLRIVCHDDCEEYLDWADLEITVRAPYDCPECGNGITEEGEECDDGNNLDNDGCGAACRLEYSDCLKINEVYYYPGTRRTANGKTEADPKNEWIELYNSCPFGLNLKNWRLADNAKTELLGDDYALNSKQYAVIAAHRSTWKFWLQIPASALKITLNKPYLFNGLDNAGDAVFLYDPYGNRADSVSWGYNTSAFSPSVPAVEAGHSISRKPAGFDTDKAADWIDTFSGSNPPGPNPGTNPHNEKEERLETLTGLFQEADENSGPSTLDGIAEIYNSEALLEGEPAGQNGDSDESTGGEPGESPAENEDTGESGDVSAENSGEVSDNSLDPSGDSGNGEIAVVELNTTAGVSIIIGTRTGHGADGETPADKAGEPDATAPARVPEDLRPPQGPPADSRPLPGNAGDDPPAALKTENITPDPLPAPAPIAGE